MADKRWLKVKQMLIQAERDAREAAWRKEADGSFKPKADNHYALGWAHAMESARRHLEETFTSKRNRQSGLRRSRSRDRRELTNT